MDGAVFCWDGPMLNVLKLLGSLTHWGFILESWTCILMISLIS